MKKVINSDIKSTGVLELKKKIKLCYFDLFQESVGYLTATIGNSLLVAIYKSEVSLKI